MPGTRRLLPPTLGYLRRADLPSFRFANGRVPQSLTNWPISSDSMSSGSAQVSRAMRRAGRRCQRAAKVAATPMANGLTSAMLAELVEPHGGSAYTSAILMDHASGSRTGEVAGIDRPTPGQQLPEPGGPHLHCHRAPHLTHAVPMIGSVLRLLCGPGPLCLVEVELLDMAVSGSRELGRVARYCG